MSASSVPREAPQPGPPLPSAGSPGAGSPTSAVLSVDSDPSCSLPPCFVAFARRHHSLGLCSLPRAEACARGPGPLVTRRPRRHPTVENTRSPRFLDDPCLHAPLFDPGGSLASGHHDATDAAFRQVNDVGSATISLSRLNHAACRPPVYASQPGSPPDHATLGSGWWPAFAGSGLSPAGSQRRFPPRLSVYMTSPFTKLCLAQ